MNIVIEGSLAERPNLKCQIVRALSIDDIMDHAFWGEKNVEIVAFDIETRNDEDISEFAIKVSIVEYFTASRMKNFIRRAEHGRHFTARRSALF
jgi:hypothetical protein